MNVSIDIITLILTSSVVSAIVSIFANSFTQKVSFRNEYYRQLIAKRLAAYQSAEIVLMQLMPQSIYNIVDSKTGEKVSLKLISPMMSKSHYDQCFKFFEETMQQSLWINSETTATLLELNSVLIDIPTELDLKENNMSFKFEDIERAKEISTKLRKLNGRLSTQIRDDLSQLHDVHAFMVKPKKKWWRKKGKREAVKPPSNQ